MTQLLCGPRFQKQDPAGHRGLGTDQAPWGPLYNQSPTVTFASARVGNYQQSTWYQGPLLGQIWVL